MQNVDDNEYDPQITYKMVEDIAKYSVISLISYVILDFNQTFYDQDQILNSRVGRIFTVISIIMFYYQLILPSYRAYQNRMADNDIPMDDETILRELIEHEREDQGGD